VAQPLLSRTKVALSPRCAEKPVAEIVEKIVVKSTRTILFEKSSILSRVEHLIASALSGSM